MADIPSVIQTWQMVEGPKFDKETRKITAPGRLEKTEIPMPELEEDRPWSRSPGAVSVTPT
jgi:hypothetical protein